MIDELTPAEIVNDDIVNRDWDRAEKALESGYHQVALAIYRRIAKSCPNALVMVGIIYEVGGGGVKRDYRAAKEWYERAIQEINDPRARLNLAKLYLHGFGVDADYNAAQYHLSLIEDQDESDVQYVRGLIAQLGLGRDADHQEAEIYYRKAMAKGHAMAVGQLGGMLLRKGKVFQFLCLLHKFVSIQKTMLKHDL